MLSLLLIGLLFSASLVVAAAGYSCNGQTFGAAQTVTIQVASDTTLWRTVSRLDLKSNLP
jgi:hypothetical protein